MDTVSSFISFFDEVPYDYIFCVSNVQYFGLFPRAELCVVILSSQFLSVCVVKV